MRFKLYSKSNIKLAFVGLALAVLGGCGVKGDPLPPLAPASLGRGRPTYKRATEKIELNKYVPQENDFKEKPQKKDSDNGDEQF